MYKCCRACLSFIIRLVMSTFCYEGKWFLFVGIFVTVASNIAFVLFLKLFSPTQSYFFSYILSLLISFGFHKNIVFQYQCSSTLSSSIVFFKYLFFRFGFLLLQLSSVFYFSQIYHPIVVGLVTQTGSALFSFIVLKYIVFVSTS